MRPFVAICVLAFVVLAGLACDAGNDLLGNRRHDLLGVSRRATPPIMFDQVVSTPQADLAAELPSVLTTPPPTDDQVITPICRNGVCFLPSQRVQQRSVMSTEVAVEMDCQTTRPRVWRGGIIRRLFRTRR